MNVFDTQDPYHGRSNGVMEMIVALREHDFRDFCRFHLQIPERTLQSAVGYGEFSEEAQYRMVQVSYRQDPKKFVERHSHLVHSLTTNVQPNGSLPDKLPPKCVYDLIDELERTGRSWPRYAREVLGIDVDKFSAELSEKVLSREQKYSLLHQWGRNGASPEELDNELTRRYQQYRGNKAF